MLRLEGTKIVLRGGGKKDIAPLYAIIRDPAVTRYLALVPPENEQQFGESLKRMMVADRDYFFIIARKSDNVAMGLIRLHWNALSVGEVSYWLGRHYWGKGYAAEAVGKIGIFAFTELGLEALTAHCFAGNSRSLALLQKLGFEAVGSHRLVSDDPLKSHEIALRVERHAFLWADPALKQPAAQGNATQAKSPPPAAPLPKKPKPKARAAVPHTDVAALRKKLRMTQEEFAERYRLPIDTIRAWEDGSRPPSEPASVLLYAISKDPDAIQRALS